MREQRNFFVHGTWNVQPPTCTVSKSEPAYSPDFGVVRGETIATMSLPDLMNRIEEVHTLRDTVSALITELVKEKIAKIDAEG